MSDSAFPTDDRELRAHAEWVARLARSLLRWDVSAADDASQEALLAAWIHPPQRSKLRPWLSRVLRNAIHSRHRSELRRSAREQATGAIGTSDPADVVILRMESHRRVVDAVLALPKAYRWTIALRYYEGLTSPEIAARLGVSEGTVRSRLQRGLALLRRQLGDDDRGLHALAMLPSGAMPATMGMAKLSLMGWIMTAKTKAMIAAGLLILAAVYVVPGVWSAPEEVTPVVAGSDPDEIEAPTPVDLAAVAPESPSRVIASGDVDPSTESAIDGRARVTGQVVLVDGQPCAGVAVELRGWARSVSDLARVGKVSWSDLTCTTEPDGRFEFPFDPPSPFQFRLSIEDLRFADWSERWSSIAPGEVLDLGRITVQPVATVRGLVRDEGGQEVARGWRVVAHDMDGRFDVGEDHASGSSEYALTRLAEGDYRIDVHHQDGRSGGPWHVKLSAGRSLDLDLTLGASARRTISLSAKLGSQVVHLKPNVVRCSGPEGSCAPVVDPGGHVDFEPVGDGPYVVSIDDPRFLPWQRSGVRPGQSLNASLDSTSRVLLSVVGVPEARRDSIVVSLRLRPPADLVGWNSIYEPRLFRPAGTPLPDPVVIDEIAGGCDYDVVIEAEGYSERWAPVLGVQALEVRAISVELTRGAALAGVVTEGDGSTPASGIQVLLYEPEPQKARQSFLMIPDGQVYSGYSSLRVPVASVRTDVTGRFAFDALRGGDYTLRARESASLHTVVDVTVLDDERREDLVLRMPDAHELRVRLIAPEGLAADGVRLVARLDDPVTEYWLRRNPPEHERPGIAVRWNEVLSLKPLPGGHTELFLEYDEFDIPLAATRTTRVRAAAQLLGDVLLEGPVTERTFDMGESLPGAVEITVLANGQPLTGATVVLERGSGAIADDRGVARIPPVPPAAYRVLVRPEDRSWSITLPDPVRVVAGAHTAVACGVLLATREVRFLDAAGQATCQGRFQVRSGWTLGDLEQDVVPDARGVATLTLPVGIQTFVVNGKEHPIEWDGNGPGFVELRVE